MNNGEKIEFGKFVIGRYDHYFDSVNNKANFWLAFNTFIIGVVLTTYKDVKDVVPCQVMGWFNGGLICLLIMAIGASILILLASLPYLSLRRKQNSPARSLMYFGDVATQELAVYKNLLDQSDSQDMANDFSRQTRELAIGLNRKYRLLNRAGNLMILLLTNLLYLIVIFIIGKVF